MSTRESDDLEIPLLGQPGTWVRVFGQRGRGEDLPTLCTVSLHFSISGFTSIQYTQDGSSVSHPDEFSGNSNFILPEIQPNSSKELTLRYEDEPELKVYLCVNSEQRLSCIKSEPIECNGELDAAMKVASRTLLYVNWWAFKYRTGIKLDAITVASVEGSNRWIFIYQPFKNVPISLSELKDRYPDFLMPLVSLYREAISNTNPYYEILMLCKVSEGVWELKHQQGLAEIQAHLISGVLPHDKRVPPEFRGAQIDDFISHVRQEFRNAIAHFELKKREIIHIPDFPIAYAQASSLLPALRYAIAIRIENLRRQALEKWRVEGRIAIVDYHDVRF